MKTYSLLEFLTQPIDTLLDNEDDYCYQDLHVAHGNPAVAATLSKITIPIIQRDYVQGHSDNKELLRNFIEILIGALENKRGLKLDFIYGSLDIKNGNVFLPLDGQQRLTTLFLLHWYIIKKESSPEDFQQKYVQILNKFSYETRDTSRRFFKELINFDFKGKPGQEIQKSYWFTEHFALDPTVKACLNALDIIDEVYAKSAHSGNLLESLNNGYIVFYILPMEQFSLSDDLYIKLNARGKVLSSFENFKADLIGHMSTIPKFTSPRENNEEKLSAMDIISAKFDNNWSNLFWKVAKHNEKKDQAIDNYFFRFIHRLLINNYILNTTGRDLNKDNTYKKLLEKEEKLSYSTFDFYNKQNLIDEQFILDLEVILDCYLAHEETITKFAKPLWDDEFKWSIFDGGFTMNHRMVFDAINQFIIHEGCNPFNETGFENWMRITWNILAEPTNRNIETNRIAMKVIRTIAPFASDIYAALAEGRVDESINGFNLVFSGQLLEEKQKAKLILSENGESWLNAIQNAESHGLFSGNIGFLLIEIKQPEELIDRLRIAEQLFDTTGTKRLITDESYSLLRYIIAKLKDWTSITKFSYLNNTNNWMANLRRSEHVKQTLHNLIAIGEFSEILAEIKHGVTLESELSEDNRDKKLAHENVYQHNEFHKWIQNHNAGDINYRQGRIYVFRPNAWHDKVMIDGFRNEFTQALIRHFNITEMYNRCEQTNYFWYEWYDCFKTIGDKSVTFHFDVENNVHIGLWGERNMHIGNVNNRSDGWIEIHRFSLDTIKSPSDIPDLLKKIEDSIAMDENSLIKDLLLEISIPLL